MYFCLQVSMYHYETILFRIFLAPLLRTVSWNLKKKGPMHFVSVIFDAGPNHMACSDVFEACEDVSLSFFLFGTF